jgi:imidazole glycerol-phosphate synthase subunit HisF
VPRAPLHRRPDTTRALRVRTVDWVMEAHRPGTGESVRTCMDNDGVRRGHDIAQLVNGRSAVSLALACAAAVTAVP